MLTTISRILYIGDVPIESTTGGEMLLYKLFEKHHPRCLKVIQTRNYKEKYKISENSSLPDVEYVTIKYPRLYGARFKLIHEINNWISFIFLLCRQKSILKIARDFKPEVILTVGHDKFWRIAQKTSDKLGVSICLINHDQWESTIDSQTLRKYLEKHFAILFKKSSKCFCVSEYMVEHYNKRFHRIAGVLYPMSIEDSKIISRVQQVRREFPNSLVFGYAGSLWNGYYNNIIALAHSLDQSSADILAYSNRTLEYLEQYGLKTKNVNILPFIRVDELLESLKRQCDVLYLPMDFDTQYEQNMKIAFPSKMGDYALLGLPILIHAPEYSSIVNWARKYESQKFSEIVTTLEKDEILAAIKRLSNAEYRETLGKNAQKIYAEFFHPDSVRSTFYN